MGKQTIQLGASANDGTGTKARAAGQMINDNFSELYGGAAFPGAPAAGQRYFRTDRGIDYFYDGTRWVSIQLFTIGASFAGDNVASLIAGVPNPFAGLYDLWMVKAVYSARMVATGTWTFTTSTFDGTTRVNIDNATQSTAALLTNEFGRFETALGLVVSSSTIDGFQFNLDRTGGTVRDGAFQLQFRVIG